ncbi:MAG: type II toxin-antitoxin system RelE/ParE family toxin [Candidatus Brocadiaceae bacterium]|nr:type II toxin-antitoxin system RelE/ParE family toxin [Candidatus Brocadiaceae bacterium]
MVKKYQVVISGRAQRSLNRITNYIAENASDIAAIKVEKGLLEAALNLSSLPDRHPILHRAMKGTIYRYIPKWSFKIIFTVEESNSNVIVIEIFHSSQDPHRLEELP